jgi:hypothetical protein
MSAAATVLTLWLAGRVEPAPAHRAVEDHGSALPGAQPVAYPKPTAPPQATS